MAKSKKIIIWGPDGREEFIDDAVFDGLSFVNKARSKTDMKQASEYIFFDNSNLVGLDGHRMHLCSIDNQGIFSRHCYEVIKISGSEIHMGNIGERSDNFFPDWKDIWPDGFYEEINVSLSFGKSNLAESYGLLVKQMPSDKVLNYTYFQDLSPMGHSVPGWHNGNLIFKAGKLGALIVPMKTDDH